MTSARHRINTAWRLLSALGVAAGWSWSASQTAFAKDYYVATTGSDSNPGTMDQPFATVQKGADTAVAGDTVYLRGGTYPLTSTVAFGTADGGANGNYVRYLAYTGETPHACWRRLKLEAAARQLAQGRSSVTEAALDAGFETPEAFVVLFK